MKKEGAVSGGVFNFNEKTLKKTIHSHTDYVSCVCILADGRIASCSRDKTIKVFSSQDYKCELTFAPHEHGGVNHILVLDNGNLVSSSYKEIAIWKITDKTYKCLKKKQGHNDDIYQTIQLTNNRLATCSGDWTIKIWENFEPFTCLKTLTGSTDSVNCVLELKNKKFLVSGGKDETIRFWDNTTYECEKEIDDVLCYTPKCLIETDDEKLVVGGRYGLISVISSETMELISTYEFTDVVADIFSLAYIGRGNVLCGDTKGTLCQIEINEFKMVSLKENVHSFVIDGILLLDNKRLITYSYDHTISIWE